MSEGPRKVWRPDNLHLGSELECYITKAKTKNRNVGHDDKRICLKFSNQDKYDGGRAMQIRTLTFHCV